VRTKAEAISDRPKVSRDLVGFFAFIILCLAVSGIGGAITATSVDTWYQTLEKPPFNPPDWVFAPVWTAIYILMGIAAWLVWRRGSIQVTGKALAVFAFQLGLNLAWSFLFFGLHLIDLALVEIVILLFTIIINTIIFWRLNSLAGLLFVPYAAWVAFATVLNSSIWLIN
jgi:tryptophan-rich sensory protein